MFFIIITVANQKGGVGKSTTVQALAAGLTLKKNKRILLIDLDPQANTSFTFGAAKEGATALGVLLGEVKLTDAIQSVKYGDILAGSKALAGADSFIIETGKEYRLKEALEEVSDRYDHVIIDTPPALGIVTINALTAADIVIIPTQADIYCLQGIAELGQTIRTVKKYCNPALKIGGILFTRFNPRSSFNKELTDLTKELAENLSTQVFETRIREAISIKKAQATQQSIFDYDPRCTAAEDYLNLIDELTGKES